MKILKKIKNFWDDESGMGVVEVVLIIIVLVGLVMLFKKQITSLVNMLLSKMRYDKSSDNSICIVDICNCNFIYLHYD